MLTALKSARLNGVPYGTKKEEKQIKDREWGSEKLANKHAAFNAMTFSWFYSTLENQGCVLI